ncbi:hypothetical protein [Sediminibacillus massiliensis]|uniref:hypothetical protein n=1 Tax=Sediminibacillus massiliensis TaxID=1926277 RepID=UPI00098877CC|nr:hypothetical protein [Sediminibacillus massiliensis]
MQMQNQTTSSQPMQQPPNMVSTKDLLYLTDILSWNLNACKKAHFFAEQCSSPDIKNALEQACQMHERHYSQILQHLNKQPNTLN